MKPHHHTPQEQRRHGASFGARWFLSILLLLAIILGQSTSAMTGHNGGPDSIWIEICSDDGSYFIQMNENGEGKAPECNHCTFCLVPLGETSSLMSSLTSAAELPELTKVLYLSDQASLSDNPEQYWSACRGPPIASIEKTMTTVACLYGKKPSRISLNTWSNPCT